MARKIKKTHTTAPVQQNAAQTASADKTRRIVIIAVCALLACAVLFGAAMGIIIGVRNASYVIVCDGVGIDEGVAKYLASYYKADYKTSLQMQGIQVTDVPAFWSQKIHPDVTTTYGDYLTMYVENSIKNLLAANSIFDSKLTLTKEDKAELSVATQEILAYRSSGDKAAFNTATSTYGFDYGDFVRATEMLYKAYILPMRLFGMDKATMAATYSAECEEFLNNYVRASLLFIRTDNTYVYDNEGKYIVDEKGNYVTRPLSEEEIAERLADIEKLKGIASGEYEIGLFSDMWKKYEKENNKELYDAYFYSSSDFTAAINEKYSSVMDLLYDLEDYKLGYTEDSKTDDKNNFVGYTFVYRDVTQAGAYISGDDKPCFDDFYDLCAYDIYDKMLSEVVAKAELRDGWDEITPVYIPYNTDYVARF